MRQWRFVISAFIGITLALSSAAKSTNKNSKLQVIVDERMELLTTIQYLSGYPVLTLASISYKTEIEEYFREYKNHNAIAMHRKIFRRFFAFDAAPTYMYHFSFPELKQISSFTRNEIEAYGFYEHRDTLLLLMKEFKDFYERSNFHRFFLNHKNMYDDMLKPVRNKIGKIDVITILEEYYGQKNKEYIVVLSPLLHDGGYGPRVSTPGGQVIYAIVGPKFDSRTVPEFDADNLLSEYVIHEFSHSFCNPLIARHRARFLKDSCLLTPIKSSQERQGYGTWETCVIEHFVRANEIVLTEKVLGLEKAAVVAETMIKKDQWIYLEGILPILKQYQANRSRYKNQGALMPQIIKYFDAKAKECK